MPRLANIKEERFAQAMARGIPAKTAYRELFPNIARPDVKGRALAKTDRVADRIEEILSEGEQSAIIKREELLNLCAAILRAKPSDADMDNSACEIRYVGKNATPVPVFPSKMAAAERIAKMMGWDKEVVRLEASERVMRLCKEFRE